MVMTQPIETPDGLGGFGLIFATPTLVYVAGGHEDEEAYFSLCVFWYRGNVF